VQCSGAGCCDPNDKDTKVKLVLDHVKRGALLALAISIERSPIYPLELVLKFSLQPLSLTWFRFHPYTLKTDQNTSFSRFYRFDRFIITSSVLCTYHLQCEKPQLPRAPPPMPRMPSYVPLPRYLTYIGST
jgi:hypothetical protein